MANVLHRETKEYRQSVNTGEFSEAVWIINPDLSKVRGVEQKYWKISGNNVSIMDAQEQVAVDIKEAEEAWANDVAEAKAALDEDRLLRAIARVIATEVSAVRPVSAAPRTQEDIIAAIKTAVDGEP